MSRCATSLVVIVASGIRSLLFVSLLLKLFFWVQLAVHSERSFFFVSGASLWGDG